MRRPSAVLTRAPLAAGFAIIVVAAASCGRDGTAEGAVEVRPAAGRRSGGCFRRDGSGRDHRADRQRRPAELGDAGPLEEGAGALRALLERAALDPVGRHQGTRDRAARRARLGLDARAQDRSLSDRLDPQGRRRAEDRQRRDGARPRQRRRPAHGGVRRIRVGHARGSGGSAHRLAVVVHPRATRRRGLGARPHARGFVDEPGARADGAARTPSTRFFDATTRGIAATRRRAAGRRSTPA